MEVGRRILIAILAFILCAWLFTVRIVIGMLGLFFEVLGDTLDMFFDVVFDPEGRK